MSKPTISDVARVAGVSKTTVSHAYSNRRHVDPETRKRIFAIAEEIGYRPNRAAQHLRSGRTGIIALASSMPFAVAAGPSRLGFLMEIAASAAVASLTRNLALCLVPPLAEGARFDAVVPDGAILVEPREGDPMLAHFLSQGVPVVSIGCAPGRPDLPCVDLQSAAVTRCVLDHLESQGARKIGLVTGVQRRCSYLESEAEHAAFCAARGQVPVQMQLDEAGGEDLAEPAIVRLLRREPGLDALFVPVDAFATGAVRAAAALGRRVPQDLRLATRYNGLRARLADPPLTALDLHLEILADLAVGLLLTRMDSGAADSVTAPTAALIARPSSV